MESSELRIVKGNTFWTLIEISAVDASGATIDDFDLSLCTDITVTKITSYKRIATADFRVMEGNVLYVMWYGPTLGATKYGLEVRGKYNGIDWRLYNDNVLTIVNTNKEANIPEYAFVSEGFFRVEPSELVILTSIPQEQSDWNETDNGKPSFIKNKPSIPSIVDDVSVDGDNLVITFSTTDGTKSVNVPLNTLFDRELYYTKSEVDDAIDRVVAQLDTLLRNSVFYSTLYKGTYLNGVTYEVGSMVKYNDMLFIAKRTTTSKPIDDYGEISDDWEYNDNV